MNNFIKPPAIIFDFDDTLVDSKAILDNALEATFTKFDIPQEVIENIDTSRSMRDYFHEVFGENVNKARDIFYRYYDQFAPKIKKIDNAEEVLKFLSNRKIYTVVVSNKHSHRLNNEISNILYWESYFAKVVGSGDVIEDKPSPLPVMHALQHLNLEDYKDVLLIGDSITDVKTAHNLGCKAVLFGEKSNNTNLPVYKSVKNHLELLDLLKKIYA